MRINGINGTNTKIGGMNMTQASDSVSKNIQNQIANAQKQLQDLSANKDMSIEEKMKKRQEIQQQITDLNNQLRQHQMEQRKEKQQAKKTGMDDMLGGSKRTAPKVASQSTGLSQASMKAMISADSAMDQARVQGSVSTKMEGRAGVLESEIKRDAALGNDVETKKEELEEVQQKAVQAESVQRNTLADANKELEAAAEADRQAEKTAKDKKTDKKDVASNGKKDKNVTEIEETETVDVDIAQETVGEDVIGTVELSVSEPVTYTHVDVRL